MSPVMTSLVFLVAGLAGAAVKAYLSNDQATFSRKSIGDVVLGGVSGILIPTVVPLPAAWNVLQQAALVAGLAYSGVDVIQNVLQKFGLALPGGPGGTDPKGDHTMRHLVLPLLLPLLLVGCGTTAQKKVQQAVAPNVIPDAIAALKDLKAKLTNLPALPADAKATHLWAESTFGPSGKTPDPVRFALANACPTATDAVGLSGQSASGGMIGQTIDGMIATLQGMQASDDPAAPQGALMLFLTQLKYGSQPDPKVQFALLRAQLNLQMDALFTGCAHLYPKKQMNDLAIALGKLGIVGFSGGTLAPLMGILP